MIVTNADAALLISSGSLLLSGLAVGWQIAEWLWSGGRPKAELHHGIAGDSSVVSSPVPRTGRLRDPARLREQGFSGTEVIGIKVTNRGRSPIEIETVTVRFRGGEASLVPVEALIGEHLPCEVGPGSNRSWYVDIDHARRLVAASRKTLQETITGVYMTAELGTGRSIRTRTKLPVPPQW